MEDLTPNLAARRSSTRVKKIGLKVATGLADSTVLAQVAQDRLDALESDNVVLEPIVVDDDDEASMDEDGGGAGFSQKVEVPKSIKRKTRRAKAMERSENDKKAPKSFLDILHEANLESLPSNVPTYSTTAVVGQPSSAARRQFCSVCGYLAPYTCIKCGARFCSCRCELIHNDTRCQKLLM